jgi:hypothetical protein
MKKINDTIMITIGLLWILVYHYSDLVNFFILVSFGKKSICIKLPKCFINLYYSIRFNLIGLSILINPRQLKYFSVIDWIKSYCYNQLSDYPYNGNFLEYIAYTDNEIMLDKMYDR